MVHSQFYTCLMLCRVFLVVLLMMASDEEKNHLNNVYCCSAYVTMHCCLCVCVCVHVCACVCVCVLDSSIFLKNYANLMNLLIVPA